MTIRNQYLLNVCRNCGEQTPVNTYNEYLPHNGFCLDLTGHYGGFTDDVENTLSRVVLCHDCSLLLARALPGVFNGTSYHSMFFDEESTSCCEFAWKSDEEDKENKAVLNGDGFGDWYRSNENQS